MRLGIRAQAILLTGVPLGFLVLLLVLALLQQARAERTLALSRHTTEALAESETIVRSIAEANLSVVAFMKTRATATLGGYRDAQARLPREAARLAELVGSDPSEAAGAIRFNRSAAAALRLIGVYLRAIETGGPQAPLVVERSTAARVVIAQWARAESTFETSEQAHALSRLGRMRSSVRFLSGLLIGCAIIGVLVTIAVAARFGLHTVHRLQLLADNARRLGSGTATLPITGSDEINLLDRVYREMAHVIKKTTLEREAAFAAYEREHHVASTLQRALLPQDMSGIPGIRFEGVYEPGQAEALIGGDWYDAVRLADGRIVISIGDVSGSGLHAAVIMASMRQVMRGVAQVYADPATLLDAADRTLKAEYPETIVTAFVAVFDPVASTLAYCSAGHPAPLIRRRDGTVHELPAHGLPLGLRVRGEGAVDARVEPIDDDSIILFYTDGLVESQRDIIEGQRRLRAALRDAPLVLPGLARSLYGTLLKGGATDDVAILAMHIDQAGVDGHALGTPVRRSRWIFDTNDRPTAQNSRAIFSETLRRHGSDEHDLFTAELIFGELLGNVVRYAPGPVEVVLDWNDAHAAVLHFLDRGNGFTVVPRLPSDLMSERGRGLFLISTIADDFNVSKRPDGGSHARVVLPAHRTALVRYDAAELISSALLRETRVI